MSAVHSDLGHCRPALPSHRARLSTKDSSAELKVCRRWLIRTRGPMRCATRLFRPTCTCSVRLTVCCCIQTFDRRRHSALLIAVRCITAAPTHARPLLRRLRGQHRVSRLFSLQNPITGTLSKLADQRVPDARPRSPQQPPRGKEALALLFPDGVAAGPLRVMALRDRWCPGTLRDLFMSKKEDACACRRELAANGLTHLQLRFEDVVILGEGGFGTVRRGRCKKTKKNYAVKMSSVVS